MLSKRNMFLITTGILVVFISLLFGTTVFTPSMIFDALTGKGDLTYDYIFLAERLPRVAIALIIGSSLAVSGTNFQALLRNSLADPYILGVSGGAAFGATAGIVLWNNYVIIILLSFLGSMLTVGFLFFLYKKLELGNTSLLLAGLALGFILQAGVMLLYFFSDSSQVHKAILWLMGDLELANRNYLFAIGLVTTLLIIISFIYHKHLNIISFGKQFSANLGVTNKSVMFIFWISSMLAAVCVAFFGIIGFVGLIVPHVMRSIYGPDHKKLIPASAVCGAFFLLLCDTLARSIHPQYPIPVGVITGFTGGVFFIVLVVRYRHYNY